MANARQSRGRRTQVVVAAWLAEHGWTKAKSVWGSAPGSDIFNVPGHAIEVKAVAKFSPQAWLRQARTNATRGQTPCVILRMNGQGEKSVDDYLVIRRLADDVLAKRGSNEI